MPLSSLRLARLWLASGLMIVTTFTSAWAQEAPVDPHYQDLILPEKPFPGFHPVAPLAKPEIDYPNCAPAPAAWHPPILFPNPEVCCPTGVVHRDWMREHTTPRWLNYRQRMLEKDYAWRVQNGHQPTCCPPWSCWGHYCDECNGIGCKKRFSWWGFGGGQCEPGCQECGTHSGCQSCGNETSALQPSATDGVTPVSLEISEGNHSEGGEVAASNEIPVSNETPESREIVKTNPTATEALQSVHSDLKLIAPDAKDSPANEIQLIADNQVFGNHGPTVETAGFCEVSDGCVQETGPVYMSHDPYRHFEGDWEECDDDHCDCPACCLKKQFEKSRDCFCKYLREDGPYEDYGGDYGYGPGAIARGVGGRGGWRREIPAMGQYWLAYPHNPYHFDQRDGRIYGAIGYGHAVGVPLAPNVQHTFNYGWGVPSSRLTPVSRMPGAPGVAIPAVPGAAGPGVLPPAYPSPLSYGFGQ